MSNRYFYFKSDLDDIKKYKRTNKLPTSLKTERDRKRFVDKWNGFKQQNNKYYINNKQIIFKSNITEFLKEFYDNPLKGYCGRDKLYAKIQEKYIGISRRQVMSFLNNLETNQIHKQPKLKSASRPIITRNPFVRWQIDLTFLNKQEKLQPILTMIDCFSKYAWAVLLKNKEAITVSKALVIILRKEKKKPSIIQSDNGSEFQNEYKKVLKKYKIKPIYSASYSPTQNAIIERFNGTLKRIIYRYMSHQGLTPDQFTQPMLNELVKNYNTSKHSITNFEPESIHSGRTTPLKKVKIKATRQEIRDRGVKIIKEGQHRFPPIRVSNYVRLSKNTDPQWRKRTSLKGYSYEPQWFADLYEVVSISKPTRIRESQYTLKNENGTVLKRKFIRKDLMIVNKNNLIKNESVDDKYEVEKILGKRVKNGITQYKIKWKNWNNRYNRWIDEDDSFRDLIDEWERNN